MTRDIATRWRLRTGIVGGAAVLGALLVAPPAVAVAAPTGVATGVATEGPPPGAVHFTCQTDPQTIQVPTGSTRLAFVVAGGQGGGSFARHQAAGTGGRGARLSGTVSVAPGQQLTVWVGCSGDTNPDTGLFTGGARGTTGGRSKDGTSGGAASAVSAGATGAPPSTQLAVAGGGGGGGGRTSEDEWGGDGGSAAPSRMRQGDGGNGKGGADGGTYGAMPSGYGGNGENGVGTFDPRSEGGGGGGGGGVRGGTGGSTRAECGGGGGGAGTSTLDPAVRDQVMTSRNFRDSGPAGDGYVSLAFS